jgi:hypothetical protein
LISGSVRSPAARRNAHGPESRLRLEDQRNLPENAMQPTPCAHRGLLPLFRPRLLIETARIAARLYRRERDLSAALAQGQAGRIVERLGESERQCEALRRARSPAYRPGRHVQVLAALIAEAAQTKASGSDALRLAT